MDRICNTYSNSSDEESDLQPKLLLRPESGSRYRAAGVLTPVPGRYEIKRERASPSFDQFTDQITAQPLAYSQKIYGDGSGSESGQGLMNDQPVTPSMSRNEQFEKFTGVNFKKWQEKMLMYLSMLDLVKFLKEDPPIIREDEVDSATAFNAIEAWKHSDLCRNYILNGLTDSLYDVYCVKRTAKELWESLDNIYKPKHAGIKKILVSQFLNYNMVDSKKVVNQVQELLLIIHEIHAEGMPLSESFQVAAIIEKLPSGWKDFKNYLMLKRKEMTVEELIVRLRIEEDSKNSKKTSKKGKQPQIESKLSPKGGISKKTKFNGKCYNCNKKGHKSSYCWLPKKVKPNETSDVESITQDFSDIDQSDVKSEVNLANRNPRDWWLDTGATQHICCDKGSFVELVPCRNEEKLYMGNSATSMIKAKGSVILKMTSTKTLKLQNVLYVPDIRKNLVSGTLLSAHGFRMVFESEKFILSKEGIYVGKGYESNGMWKFSVL